MHRNVAEEVIPELDENMATIMSMRGTAPDRRPTVHEIFGMSSESNETNSTSPGVDIGAGGASGDFASASVHASRPSSSQPMPIIGSKTIAAGREIFPSAPVRGTSLDTFMSAPLAGKVSASTSVDIESGLVDDGSTSVDRCDQGRHHGPGADAVMPESLHKTSYESTFPFKHARGYSRDRSRSHERQKTEAEVHLLQEEDGKEEDEDKKKA